MAIRTPDFHAQAMTSPAALLADLRARRQREEDEENEWLRLLGQLDFPGPAAGPPQPHVSPKSGLTDIAALNKVASSPVMAAFLGPMFGAF